MCRNVSKVAGVIDTPFVKVGKNSNNESIYYCVVVIPNMKNPNAYKRVLVGFTSDQLNIANDYTGKKVIVTGYLENTGRYTYLRADVIRLCADMKAISSLNTAYIEGSVYIEPRDIGRMRKFSVLTTDKFGNEVVLRCVGTKKHVPDLHDGEQVKVSGVINMLENESFTRNLVYTHKVSVINELPVAE